MTSLFCRYVRSFGTTLMQTALLLLALSGSTAGALAPGAYASVAVGDTHACGLLATGGVECWGANSSVIPSTVKSVAPVAMASVTTAVQLSSGRGHSCAVLANGGVRCWGTNTQGQLGNNTTAAESLLPVTVSGITTAQQVSAGYSHSCAVLVGGSVQCWGANARAQLGNNSTVDSLIPVTVAGINTAVQVSAGQDYSCALLTSGGIKCWGRDFQGKLGGGILNCGLACFIPVDVSGVTTAISVASGPNHSCAVLSTGDVRCWGDNTYGQVGDNTILLPRPTPVAVIGISTATHVTVGQFHSCARLQNGTVQCWGRNTFGQLGKDGAPSPSLTPVTVDGITSATQVSAGGLQSCAVLLGGGARCWGSNSSGQLGNSGSPSSLFPVAVSGINSAVGIGSGNQHSCALLGSGAVQCWGGNGTGALGNGTTTGSLSPVSVSGLTTAIQVSAGQSRTCAVLSTGAAHCWGLNSLIPVAVTGLTTAVALDARGGHSCALLSGGSVQCWGNNNLGQLGNNSTINSVTPVNVVGITTATDVSAGGLSCARLTGGTVQCWGTGLLGNGISGQSLVPVLVSGITTATKVAAGGSHSCALLASGGVQCWGNNSVGQLGDGTTSQGLTPVTVVGVSSAISVSAGANHSCVVLTGGAVQCWGAGESGQLGNNGSADSPIPVTVSGLGALSATAVSAGTLHSCAVFANGSVRCWGANNSGQLGDENGTATGLAPGPVLPLACTLDVDGDGTVSTLTDMLMLSRVSLGLSGTAVTNGAVGSQATRSTWPDIRAYLTRSCGMRGLAP